MSEIVLKEFRATLDRFVEADEFSGAVLVAKNQTILLQHAYGMAHQGYGVPNRVDTKFNLGSMNKMFTAVAIAQLAEQSKLAFSDPVSKHLPDYPPEVAEKVTIHHLLTHTSGMGSYWNERFFSVWADLRTVDDYLPLFRDDPLSFEPGEKFQYSNAGFVVLGAIIERVSGQDYFTYVREHIYEPAGMHDTDAYEMDRSIPNLALGYTHLNRKGELEAGPRRNNLFINAVKGGPAGGGYSTVEDLFRFRLAFREHRLLSAEFTALVLTGRVVRPDKPDITYAYGWQNVTVNGHRIVGHSGGAPGISAQFDLYLDLGYTVVVLANYGAHGAPIAPRIANILREQLAS
ncbi:MAG: serine hydrolase domain-containing protein [Ktedonobacteraceae bacterium]